MSRQETPLMRKIETQMNAAISNQTDWKSGNTEIVFDPMEMLSIVFLHGNKIAEVGENFIRLFDGGFQSQTTKSRLNAILSEHGESGDCVFQKDFMWFVRMNTVQGLSTVPFFNSMRLGWIPQSFLSSYLTLTMESLFETLAAELEITVDYLLEEFILDDDVNIGVILEEYVDTTKTGT